MSVHSLWAKTSHLAACRRSEARKVEHVANEPIILAPEAEAVGPISPELHRDIFQLALRYEARASYEMARDAYDILSRVEGVSVEVARIAEQRSVYLSLILGQLDAAERTIFRALDARVAAAPRTDLVLMLAQATQRAGDAGKTLHLLSDTFLETNTENLARPSLARAHALRARAFDSLGRIHDADAEWDASLAISEAAVVNINAGATDRELAVVADLAGEALFRRAFRVQADAERLKMPTYTGTGNKDEVLRFLSTEVSRWYQAKKEKLEAVSDAYQRVLEIEPIPPPRWVIAASVQVGNQWSDFVRDFRSAPIPREWEPDLEIRTEYYGTFDSPEEPFRQFSKSAFLVALEWGQRFRVSNEDTRAAERWLADHYRFEFHHLDELMPQADGRGAERFPLAPLELHPTSH
jgi:hypothetical protein